MKPVSREIPPRPVGENVLVIFAAFLGIGAASWLTNFWGVKAGDLAIAVYVLIGIPTYKFCLISCNWVYAFWRLGRKS